MYKKEFLEAIERSERFGLSTPSIQTCESRFLNTEVFQPLQYAIAKGMGEFDENEIVAQCLSLHIRMKPIIEKELNCPVFYTIGWVNIDDYTMFKQSEASLKSMLENGIPGPEVNIHAWLTLPSMEVLDFSLPTTYAKVNNTKQGVGMAITMHPSDLSGGMMYRPMLIGEEFLLRTGAMKFPVFI